MEEIYPRFGDLPLNRRIDTHFTSLYFFCNHRRANMYKPQQQQQQQHLVDLQDTAGFRPDSKSWLSGVDDSSLSRTFSSLSAAAATASATGNVDPVLFNDLVEMVPLVQSLIVRKPLRFNSFRFILFSRNLERCVYCSFAIFLFEIETLGPESEFFVYQKGFNDLY